MINLKQGKQKSNIGQRPFFIAAFVLFVAAALFPFGWLATVWPGFSKAAEFIFGSSLSHIIGHFVLFIFIGGAVLTLFPRLRSRVWLYAGIMLMLGLVQESLQIFTFKQIMPGLNELLDITIDLLGALTIFIIWSRKK